MTNHHPHPLPRIRHLPDPVHSQGLERLGNEITELAAHLDAGEYQFLHLIGIFDEERGWEGPGIGTCATWLNWKCGISIGVAREKVRVSRALPNLPQISKAFSEGRISFSKVRAMTRVATSQNEEALLNVALHGTAMHVETQVRLYRRVKRIEALEDENLRHAKRELSYYIEDSGFWVFKGRFTPEQGALISKALEAAMDEAFEEQQSVPEMVEKELDRSQPWDKGVSVPVDQKRADAMERVAETFLAAKNSNQSGGDRYLLNIHTNMDTLEKEGTGAESALEERSHVPAETSRRMACDASVVHWHETAEGEPLNVGRKTRTIPPAIRRALKRRDGGCRFPGCACSRFVDAHHIQHWADGGETSMDNLVLLCRKHHRLVHEAGYGIQTGQYGMVEFTLPDGQVIPNGPDGRSRGNLLKVQTMNRANGIEITSQTSIPMWWGDRMDHQMAVQAVLQCEGKL
ncbi:DUF222 domain-containing protein [Pseudomonadota bacterium]